MSATILLTMVGIPNCIIELVDSTCKDNTDMQYVIIPKKNLSKSQKW